MILMTHNAAELLRSMLTSTQAAPDQALRLAPDGRGGIARTIAAVQAGDVTVADAAGPLLAVEAALARRLDGLVLDWVVGERGTARLGRFAFRRPTPAELTGGSPVAGEAGDQVAEPEKGL